MEREDTQPWYRQFWPWFIIALPASAVIAGLTTLWISMQSVDSLVVHSDDGVNVATERNLAAEREADRLGLAANVVFKSNSGTIAVTVSSMYDFEHPQSLQLRLRHPTIASRDINIELLPALPDNDGKPVWAGHFVTPPVGRYYMTLSADQLWRLSSEWSGDPHIRLGHAGPPGNGRD